MSSDGTFIRAFVEADAVRQFNIDMQQGSYPGYAAADRTRNRAGGDDRPVRGYAIRWVNAFTALPDGSVTAEICSLQSITPDGSVAEGLLNDTLKYHRVGPPPPSNQQGPARAPMVSVFGGWYATELAAQVPITAESVGPCTQTTPNVDKTNVDNAPGWPAESK